MPVGTAHVGCLVTDAVGAVGKAFTVRATALLVVVPQLLVAEYLILFPLSAYATVYGKVKLA
ncbi:hypothetical protein D3C85_1046550 [compost metagenome]